MKFLCVFYIWVVLAKSMFALNTVMSPASIFIWGNRFEQFKKESQVDIENQCKMYLVNEKLGYSMDKKENVKIQMMAPNRKSEKDADIKRKCLSYLKKKQNELKEEEKQRQERIMEAKVNEIFHKFLASRIKSSILTDFLTRRY
jgi:hypothetical protein